MKNGKLFCCYSIPLRDFLISNNIRYELCAKNPNNNNMMWIFIKNEKLNSLLKIWSCK